MTSVDPHTSGCNSSIFRANPALEVGAARLGNRPATCGDGTAGAIVGGGLRILLLGQFRVEIRGAVVTDWRRQSSATLLKLLLLADQHRLRRESVMMLLNPHADLSAARAALATAGHTLRHPLEPTLAAGKPSRYLVQEGELLSLHLGPDDFVDLRAFQAADRAADPLEALESAAALYVGDLLPEETGDWCIGPREALRLRRHGMLPALQEALTRHGRHAGALATLQDLLAVDPAQEEAARRLMNLLVRQGRRAEALRIYDRVKLALKRELRARPSAELEALARTLRAGEAPRRPRPVTAAAPLAFLVPEPRQALARLIGREAELAQVRRIMQAAREGKGSMVLLIGEAGIGKTRLAEESAEAALLFGFTILWGRSGDGEQDLPYAPFAEALRSYCLTRPAKAPRGDLIGAEAVLTILPELSGTVGLAPPAPLGNAGAERLRLWSAVRTLLDAASRHHPITLILDDLHWADAETLGLLTFPARRGGDRRLFILGTSRDDLPDTHPVRSLILEGRRQGGVTTIEVPIFGPDEAPILADRMLGGPLSERRAHALHARCNGNPFFATELLALLAARRAESGERGDVIDDEVLERDEALPVTVRQTLARRLDRLGMTTRVLLRAGSVLGLRFDADLVAALAAQDRTACEDALDEAVATGLLREELNVGGTCYVLVHSLLRRTLYEELLPGQRRRLHERAGQALAARYETRGNPSAETIAHHFVRTNDHTRAAYWLAKAGDHAATLHASAPAIQYYVQACEQLAGATNGGEQADPARLHERLGDLRLLEGEYEAAREDFARARALGRNAEDLASLWVKEGTAWEKSSDYDRALASFDRAEETIESSTAVEAGARRALIAAIALRRGDVRFLRGDHADALDSATLALHLLGEDAEHADIARAHSLIGRVACVQGAYDSAEERHGRAPAIFERLGDPAGAALCWNNKGAVAWYRSDYDRAEACFRHSLALKERIGDQDGIAGAWNNLGLIAANRCDIAEAEERHRRALVIQERTGNQHAEANSLSALGLMAYQRCDFAAADAYFTRCLPVFEQIADRSGVAHVKQSLGLSALDRGDYTVAECHVQESLGLYEQLRDPAGTAHQLLRMSVVAWARGDLRTAAEWLERARRAAEAIAYEPVSADAMFNLGRLAGERGDYPSAGSTLRQAHRMIQLVGGVEEALLTMLECVHVYCLAGLTRRAARLFSAVERIVAKRGVGPAILKAVRMRAEVALALANPDRALAAAEQALDLARGHGQRREEGLALVLAGRAHLAAGRLDLAERCLREGVEVLDGIGSALESARARVALTEARV